MIKISLKTIILGSVAGCFVLLSCVQGAIEIMPAKSIHHTSQLPKEIFKKSSLAPIRHESKSIKRATASVITFTTSVIALRSPVTSQTVHASEPFQIRRFITPTTGPLSFGLIKAPPAKNDLQAKKTQVSAKKSKKKSSLNDTVKRRLVATVYSTRKFHCAACEQLKAWVQAKGIPESQIKFNYSDPKWIRSYPTVVYRDGSKTDNGQRLKELY